MGPDPTRLVSLWEEEVRTQTCTERRPREDTGRRRPSAHQGQSPLRSLEGTDSADTLPSAFRPPERWDNQFLRFKPPSLWCFVITNLAILYRRWENHFSPSACWGIPEWLPLFRRGWGLSSLAGKSVSFFWVGTHCSKRGPGGLQLGPTWLYPWILGKP